VRRELNVLAEMEKTAFLSQEQLQGQSADKARKAIEEQQAAAAARLVEENQKKEARRKLREAENAELAEKEKALQTQREEAARQAELDSAAAAALAPIAYTPLGDAPQVLQRIVREKDAAWGHLKGDAKEAIRQSSTRQSYLYTQEIQPLLSLLDMKQPGQRELGDTLFAASVLRRAEYACKNGKDDKRYKHPSADYPKQAGAALEKFWSLEVPAEQEAAHLALRERILHSPSLVIAALGSEEDLNGLRKMNERLVLNGSTFETRPESELVKNRTALAHTLLRGAGIEVSAVETQAAPLTEAPSADTAPAPVAEVPPTTSSEDVVTFKPVTAPSHDAVTPEAASPPSFQPLSQPEIEARKIKRSEAFETTQARLLAEAELQLMDASSQGFTHFESRLDLNKPGFPIALVFYKEESTAKGVETKMKRQFLQKYDQEYKERGIPLTLEDAVELKIAVQSAFLNGNEVNKGLCSASTLTSSAAKLIDRDAPIFFDPKKAFPVRDFSVKKNGVGGYTMDLEVLDPYTKQPVIIGVPLGVSALNYDAAELQERDARAQYILDYLQGKQKSPANIFVKKRDIWDVLRGHVQAGGKQWFSTESEILPGFEEPQVIYKSDKQKITLAPVTLTRELGPTPSWNLQCILHVNEEPGSKSLGRRLRSRKIDLCTDNLPLAYVRASDALLGVENSDGATLAEGLLTKLQGHMKGWDVHWTEEQKAGNGREVAIVREKRLSDAPVDHTKLWYDPNNPLLEPITAYRTAERKIVRLHDKNPLQHFLDDTRGYLHDVGVVYDAEAIKKDPQHGNSCITLRAIRCNTPDVLNSAPPIPPEYVYTDEVDKRRPVEYRIIIPAGLEEAIPAFVAQVHQHVRHWAEDAYSSATKVKEGAQQQVKRSKPLEWRSNQLPDAMKRAVEALYKDHFPIPGVKPLGGEWHTSKTQAAIARAFGDDPEISYASQLNGQTASNAIQRL